MKVALFTSLRRIEVADAPEPLLARPDDVLLAIDRVGVCGSDVHYYLDGRIGDQVLCYPATLGHECSGTVLAVGPRGKHLGGRRPRGHRSGLPLRRLRPVPLWPFSHLPQAALHGPAWSGPRRLGRARGRSGRLLCQDPRLGLIGRSDARRAAIRGAARGEARRDLSPDMKVAVLGTGPIGLSVLLCAKATAACTAVVTDLLDERLAVARRCGADVTINARRNDVAAESARAGFARVRCRLRVFRRSGLRGAGRSAAEARRRQ